MENEQQTNTTVSVEPTAEDGQTAGAATTTLAAAADSYQFPDSLDKYTFNAPEGVGIDEASLSAFKAFAFENKITEKQAEALLSFQDKVNKDAAESIKAAHQERINQYKQSLGDKYESHVQQARKAYEKLGLSDEQVTNMEASLGYQKTMDVLKFLGDSITEDSVNAGGTTAPTPQAELEELLSNPEHKKQILDMKGAAYKRFVELTNKSGKAPL